MSVISNYLKHSSGFFQSIMINFKILFWEECKSQIICRFQSGTYSIFCQTRSVLQPEFILGKLMLGRLIKALDQLLHISEAVPAKQMNGNSAVYLSSFINDKGNYDQET